VRLLDETGQELLYFGVVPVEEMQKSGSLIFGTYNFTNLEYDKNYIPSVIPVERAADGRCLCPVSGKPYDATAVCSCVAADWHSVRMTRGLF
uniref:ILCR1 Ig-like domain-containing protein n=1 Tax=Meloidogyne javanica TaxID=6303 RepID=A0A915MWX8_MELJA